MSQTIFNIDDDLINLNIDNIIIRSIQTFFARFTAVKPDNTLVSTVFTILKGIYVYKKKHIILRAPTGNGKTVIAFTIHHCSSFINTVLDLQDVNGDTDTNSLRLALLENPELIWMQRCNSYILTSSKQLQQQIENDLPRFDMVDTIKMLKGTKNYLCTYNRHYVDSNLTDEELPDYSQRLCKGKKTEEIQELACFANGDCEYLMRRYEASMAPSTVFNYAYFLTVINSKSFVKFFEKRFLTIADEAHLLPEIILSQFNIELTKYGLNRVKTLVEKINFNFPFFADMGGSNLIPLINEAAKFFRKKNATIDDVLNYFTVFTLILSKFDDIWNESISNKDNPHIVASLQSMFKDSYNDLVETVSTQLKQHSEILLELNKRWAKDGLIESSVVSFEDGSDLYKFNIYDLSEADMSRKYFVENVDVCLYMSATIHVDNHAKQMGLKPDEYLGLSIDSNFDWSNSPIYLCNSGYLNYNNFANNIDKVLDDTISICQNLHPNNKGIIHTATFNIGERLKNRLQYHKDKLNSNIDIGRFLFYETTDQKEAHIQLMRDNPDKHYVIVGPSLYEGIDLKDDLGRFNILVKVPYSALSDYIKKKMEREPWWYESNTIEKVEQAIGRTNRHKNDWSVTYLLDNGFNRIYPKLQKHNAERVKYYKI